MARRKARVQINLPPELVKKARKHGLNISKVCENALKDMIKRIEASNPVSCEGDDKNRRFLLVRPPGLEPRPSAWQADVLPG